MGQCKLVYHVLIVCLVIFFLSYTFSGETQPNIEVTRYDKNVHIFKHCLIIWKQFDFNSSTSNVLEKIYSTFYDLHASVFLNTPYVIKYGTNAPLPNINVPGLPLEPPQYTKHLSCQLQFHEFQKENLTPQILSRGETDPSFVIYFCNKKLSKSEVANLLISEIFHINYSGVPMYLDSTNGTLYLICVECQNEILYHVALNLHHSSEIRVTWNMLQKNLNGLTVRMPSTGAKETFCLQFSNTSTPVLVKHMIECLLKSRLNVSFSSVPFINIPNIDLFPEVLVDENIAGILKQARSSWLKYEFSAPSIELKQYAFIILAGDSVQTSLHAMTQPFHQNVWISLSVAMLAMPLALMITSAKKLNFNWWSFENCLNWVFLTLASVVNQCNDEVSKLFRTYQSAGLWILWNFFSLIVMNSYDGQLYSFLASGTNPQAPDSLEELASTDMSVVTISTFTRLLGRTQSTHSTLLSLLQPASREKSLQLPKYYNVLASKIHFVTMSRTDFVNITREIVNFDKAKSRKGYAFLDTSFLAKLFDPILDMQPKRKIIKRKNINNFNSCQGWLIRKFFAFNKIQQVLWQIYEGGFQGIWANKYLLGTQLNVAKNMKKSYYRVRNINIVGFMLESAKGGAVLRSANWEDDFDPKAMSLDTIWGILRIGMILLASSLLFLVGEICGVKFGLIKGK